MENITPEQIGVPLVMAIIIAVFVLVWGDRPELAAAVRAHAGLPGCQAKLDEAIQALGPLALGGEVVPDWVRGFIEDAARSRACPGCGRMWPLKTRSEAIAPLATTFLDCVNDHNNQKSVECHPSGLELGTELVAAASDLAGWAPYL